MRLRSFGGFREERQSHPVEPATGGLFDLGLPMSFVRCSKTICKMVFGRVPDGIALHPIMKRGIIAFCLILGCVWAAIEWTESEKQHRSEFVIEVVNRSDDSLGRVCLRGIGEVGEIGTIPDGRSKRVTLTDRQARERVFLSFVTSDQRERNTGIILDRDADVGGQVIRMQVRADHSVSVDGGEL